VTDRLAKTAEELRREFDAAFAAAPAPARPGAIAFLALRVGTEPFAVRLLDTAGLVPARKLVHVPSAHPALLGITGLRGAIVPVFSLAALLGRRGVAEDAPWHLACGREGGRIALAFTRYEGHVAAEASAVRDAGGARAADDHVVELLSTGGELRPVIGIRSLLASITGNAGGAGP
jgi:chemotaxis signal transduction protein